MAIQQLIKDIKCQLNNSQDITTSNFVCENKTQCGLVFIDSAVDTSYLAAFLGDNRGSLFKQVGTTEKPDIVVAKLSFDAKQPQRICHKSAGFCKNQPNSNKLKAFFNKTKVHSTMHFYIFVM